MFATLLLSEQIVTIVHVHMFLPLCYNLDRGCLSCSVASFGGWYLPDHVSIRPLLYISDMLPCKKPICVPLR